MQLKFTLGAGIFGKAESVNSVGFAGEISEEESVSEVTFLPTFAEVFANIAKIYLETVCVYCAETDKKSIISQY